MIFKRFSFKKKMEIFFDKFYLKFKSLLRLFFVFRDFKSVWFFSKK